MNRKIRVSFFCLYCDSANHIVFENEEGDLDYILWKCPTDGCDCQRVIKKPEIIIFDDGQEYFWTPEWQKEEAEVDKDIKEGNMSKEFNNAEDFIKELDK